MPLHMSTQMPEEQQLQTQADSNHRTCKEHMQTFYQSLLHPMGTDGFYHHPHPPLEAVLRVGSELCPEMCQWKQISWSPHRLTARPR